MRPIHWVLLIILSILWGATFIFAKEALPYLPPLTLTLARVAIGAAVLVPMLLVFGYRLPNTSAQWRARKSVMLPAPQYRSYTFSVMLYPWRIARRM